MKIAQVSPPIERVPPHTYGGTERIVSFLTEQLVADGHEVTLFASGDSVTKAKLVATSKKSLRLDPRVKDYLPHLLIQIEEVRRHADQFDIVHFHTDLMHYPVACQLGRKALTTLHGRLDFPDLAPFFEYFHDTQVVSISKAQREPQPRLNYLATIHHGLPDNLLRFSPQAKGGYLAFLGRICPEKRPDRAIGISKRAGLPLKIAGKVDRVDRAYYDKDIKPLIDENSHVEYIGEIGDKQKETFLGDALALLNPIDMPEPFGLVMIEAFSCGTPVVVYRRGSVSEVMEHGVSGFIVESDDEAVDALLRVGSLDRAKVRKVFERRFTAERMARNYAELYQDILDRANPSACEACVIDRTQPTTSL
jgi:glycosyltransferase involved in cell wall biosynthesis